MKRIYLSFAPHEKWRDGRQKKWLEGKSSCGYDAPVDSHVLKILEQNNKGERCAIEVYSRIPQKPKGTADAITYNMIRKIMEDEVGHEEDLENLKQDMSMISK